MMPKEGKAVIVNGNRPPCNKLWRSQQAGAPIQDGGADKDVINGQ
jgi:hypothetical protein